MLKKLVYMIAVLFIIAVPRAYAENNVDIEVGSSINVAQQQERLTACVALEQPSDTDWRFEYEITDYYGKHIYGSSGTIPSGAQSCNVLTGVSNVGWYTMSVIYSGGAVSEDFAVVYNSSQRSEYGNTPFAADFAGQGIIKDAELLREYSEAVKLAGVDWVRERFYWAQVEPAQNRYDFSNFDEGIDIISGAGLKILNMVPDYPAWVTDGSIIPTNLLNVYNSFKTFAERYDGKVYGWEIGNEADLKTVSADAYSSVVKAALAGVEASGADTYKMFGGFALSPQVSDFSEICLKNDLLSYSDCYNMHTHKTDTGKTPQDIQYSSLQSHMQQCFGYAKSDVPLWITESGMYMDVSGSGQMTWEQKKRQAEYLVTSTLRSLAEGTDKHFWFVIPSYIEAGRELGVFSPSHTPNPAYCAQSVMTYMLGKAEYRGELAAVPDEVQGYLFDRGRQDVAVLWSSADRYIQICTKDPVIIADIMGNETERQPLNGYIRLKITSEPMYIIFSEKCDEINFYPEEINAVQTEHKIYSVEDKVIISAYFDETGIDVSHKDGYVVGQDEDKEIRLYIYNLSGADVAGTLVSEDSGSFETVFEDERVEIPAYSRRVVRGVVKNKENAVPGQSECLGYRILLDSGKYTSAASPQVVLEDTSPVISTVEFENSKSSGSWELSHAASGTVADCTDTGNGVEFSIDFSRASAKWFYPMFDVTENLNDENSSGIAFSVDSAEDYSNSEMNVFLYYSDGRVYFAGNDANLFLLADEHTFYLNWNDFILYDSPLEGWADTRPFDPSLITRIAVGCTASTDIIEYSLSNIRAYFRESSQNAENDPISLTPSDTAVYRSEDIFPIEVNISDKIEIERTEVYINGKLYGEYGTGKNSIRLDPSFTSGKEKLNIFVYVYTHDGKSYIKQASYKVNDLYYW